MMRRLVWALASVVVLGGAAFAVASVAGADSGGRYRTATVAIGDVSQTVSVSGTVDRVNRADVSVGTAGSLATLSVAVGDQVSAGQELGALDTTSLQADVDKAQSDLDQAEDALTAAEDAVEEATDDSGDAPDAPATDDLVRAVKDAQSTAAAALTAAADAVAAQQSACADPTAPACTAAGAATLRAQQSVQAAQEKLQAGLTALSAAVQSAQAAQSQEPSDSSRSGPDGSASSVAEAQANVDQAKVKLVEAQQALSGATLTSPITGTVASVAAAVGDQVSAGTAVVVVVGEGAAEVSATVAVEQLGDLRVGQTATVTPVGTSDEVTGEVTRVSTTPDPGADTVAYPVTITIDKPPATMAAGSSATASIVVATAKGVLTVPTSAVNRGLMTTLSGDQVTVTPVTVGAVGLTRTEIEEGVSRGDVVVLADLDAPLPTGDSANQGGFLGGGPVSGPVVGGGPMVRKGGK
jgi:multidrug efflux pump subunit AcrA (membrane-fusion protein)